jgi:hypothetical protein
VSFPRFIDFVVSEEDLLTVGGRSHKWEPGVKEWVKLPEKRASGKAKPAKPA